MVKSVAPKVLLLTTKPINDLGAGGAILRNVLTFFPKDRLFYFQLQRGTELGHADSTHGIKSEVGHEITKYGLRRFGARADRISRPLFERYKETVLIPRIVAQAVVFGKTHKVDVLWATLTSATIVRIASRVARELGVPLVSTVWDPPEYKICRQYQLDEHSSLRLMRAFAECLHHSKCVAVPSYEMRHKYEVEHGATCVVMLNGMSDQSELRNSGARNDSKKLIIASAGSVYAKDEWSAFLSALASTGWKIAGRDVAIRQYGSRISQTCPFPVRIEYRGWLGPQQLAEELAVDTPERLTKLVSALELLSDTYNLPIVCSLHPRTRSKMEAFGLNFEYGQIRYLPPLGFFDFVALQKASLCVLSDSGTVQEECCILRRPVATIRDVTERPETIECGSNVLTGLDPARILSIVDHVLKQDNSWQPPAEYLATNVSDTAINILLSHHDFHA